VKQLIGSIKQAPHYILDNDYIHSGYRIGFNTPKKVLGSLFMLHNESVNVWSHLLGVIVFIIFIGYTAIKLGPNIDPDFHTKMMEQFNALYRMSDDVSF
jgi:adiponectin receptor